MQSNFQQFVSSNKGKLITFKHQGATVSKYVVDVCGEYFTSKGRQTDAKIDGFYYFEECEICKPTLIETLAKHKYVVLIGEKSPMPDAFFEYQDCKVVNDTLMINGKQLSVATSDVSFRASYIGEVWAIVEGKYTQVWKKTNGNFIIDGDDFKKVCVKKEIGGPEDEIKKRKFQWYKENANDWFKLCGKIGTFKSDKFMYVLGKIKTEPYSETLYGELCSSYEGLRDLFQKELKNNRKNPRVQALVKRFLVLTNNFRKNFGNKGVHRLLDLINAEISIEGENEYERMFETVSGASGPVIATEGLGSSPEGSSVRSTSGASGPVKYMDVPVYIEYRGKAKTVEIMNEYTHKNGKEYVWVKDLTDYGKTKTLFKEYITYM